MTKFLLFILFVCSFQSNLFAQDIPTLEEMKRLKLPKSIQDYVDILSKNKESGILDSLQENMLNELLDSSILKKEPGILLYDKVYSLEKMLFLLDNPCTEEEMVDIFLNLHHCIREIIPQLLHRITDTTYVELKHIMFYVIKDRPETYNPEHKHVEFLYQKVPDDIFKVGGRANFILKEISGKDFGTIRKNSTQKRLIKIQKKWIKWVRKFIEK